MDLSIIIVSWNSQKFIRENLEAIYKNTKNIDFEIFCVDNNSQDKTVKIIKKEFPKVKLIANDKNLGFAKANNQAIRKSKGRYVLLLNPDMRVLEGTLEKMVQWMDKDSDVGVGGCHLIDEKGETIFHIRRFPKIFDQLAIILKIPHIFPKVLDRYLMKDFDYDKDAEVDSLRGSFFMIRRGLIKEIGYLDERFFIWFEEVDYCKRVKKSSWKVMYCSSVKCIDYVGQSFAQVPRGKTQKYFKDSMLKYFKKWHPIWQYYFLKCFWPIGIFFVFLGSVLNFKKRNKRKD